MKKVYLTVVALFATIQFSHAQWSTSGNNIYNSNSGNIGIGTTSPSTLLDVNGVASFGTLSSLGTQLLIRGGTSGTSMLTLKRTAGAPAQFSFGLAGGGLSVVDETNSAMVANMFGDDGSNSLYLGQRNTITGGINTRPSLLSGLTISPALGADISVANFIIQGNMGTGAGTPGDILFKTASALASGSTAQSGTTRLTIKHSTGNVGIGTTTPDAKLAVNGTIHTKEVKVDMTGWSDYVFKPNYNLPSLESVKIFIDKNQHLPEVPSEQEVLKNGIELGEMNKILIKKVEELTLYLIEQNKQLQDQQKVNQSLQDQINVLTKTVQPIK